MDPWAAAVRDVARYASTGAAAIEAAGRLPDDLVERAFDLGLFKLTVAKAENGPGLTPLCAYRVGRELARADGSLGWLAMVSTA